MISQRPKSLMDTEKTMRKRRPQIAALDNSATKMSILRDRRSCRDIVDRLKRCESELRGIQLQIHEGKCCLSAAGQLAQIRKGLDRVFAKMTICYIEQELDARLIASPQTNVRSEAIKVGMGKLLSPISEPR